jgi:AcrR family transcriptional regulator
MTLIPVAPVVSEVPGRIARAAIALFSRQGYHGTSTREIARLADVSEVTVFRYFEHKEDIFLSALSTCFKSFKSRLASFDREAENRTPQTMLPHLMVLLVDTTTISPELFKLVAIAFLELHGRAEDLCLEQLTPLFSAIARYLSGCMERGELRNLNPGIVAAAMALLVVAQPELSKLIAGTGFLRMSGRESIDEYTKFWLKVLVP